MSDWIQNSNGNYVYVLDSDDVMTVYKKNGEWFGVYDGRFTECGFKHPEQAMALMERAVLDDCLHLLVKKTPPQTGWRKTKTGGYHCVRRTGMLTVKQAKSGKWYLVVDQTLLADQWFNTAEEAMQRGDQL